jgi:hypothetical protein
MAVIIGILVGLAGLVLLVMGMGFFLAFRLALRHFDRALKTEFAAQSRDQIEQAAMKIKNPLARNFVIKHLVHTGGAVTVSLVRGGLESRKNTGLYMALGGAFLLIASFLTPRWLPLVGL